MSPADLTATLEELHAAAFGWAMSCCGWDRTAAEDVLQAPYLNLPTHRPHPLRARKGRAQDPAGGRTRMIEQAFEALRREDAAGAPPFAATIAAARARRTARPRRRALGLIAAVIVVVAVVVISLRRER